MQEGKRGLVQYDFSKPIRITAMRSGGLDTLFYAFALSLCLTAMILILSLREGKFRFEFTFWRTLICLPIAMVAIVLFQLLRELRKYPPKLSKQSVWTMEELMALTGKDRKETERIITRILEACFTVDERCILKEGASAPADDAAPARPGGPAAEEKKDGFSRFDS